MSLRAATAYPRQPREAYYTPDHATQVLVDALPVLAMGGYEVWEPAAGAGHVARVLARLFPVTASDIQPAAETVFDVRTADFFGCRADWILSRQRLAIITNPPYGVQNRLACKFLHHAMTYAADTRGLVALLLPFEFDAAASRDDLVGNHPAFAAKITVGRRIRWLNIPQKENSPMGNHAWFIWSWNRRVRRLLRDRPMRTL